MLVLVSEALTAIHAAVMLSDNLPYPVRYVVACPQAHGDLWGVVASESVGPPLFIGLDAWSCYHRKVLSARG
jgi:hypothetical protein